MKGFLYSQINDTLEHIASEIENNPTISTEIQDGTENLGES